MSFRPGQSGNPAGKRPGTRHRVTSAVEELLAGDAQALTLKAVELALQGDTTALRMCLDRIAPIRRARVRFPLPMPETLADLPRAVASLVAAVSDGTLAPDEGAAVAAMLETHRRTIESVDLEKRIVALEARHHEREP
jgi:Family of unknown function (DUF5681)